LKLSCLAPAKINLTLRITGKRPDGYHELSSLVVFADFGDHLTVQPARCDSSQTVSLKLAGPFGRFLRAEDDNLVLQAARALRQTVLQEDTVLETVLAPVEIILEKNLPLASGIGGGSSDAAAILYLLNRLWGLNWSFERLSHLALSLGADVPMCLRAIAEQTVQNSGQNMSSEKRPSAFALQVSGIGETMQKAAAPPFYLVCVNPLKAVSTPVIFQAWGTQTHQFSISKDCPDNQSHDAFMSWLKEQNNDLQGPAMNLCPDIADIVTLFEATEDCLIARMSGSGATCFGLYKTIKAAQQAMKTIQQARPEFWVMAGALFTKREVTL
jgi:4-diphosphocytidyl-2-C-methyl-D-erythritol kinase